MPLVSVEKMAKSLAAVALLAHPALAQDEFLTPFDPNVLWPEPITLESSFADLGIDIKGFDVAMSVAAAQDASDGEILDRTWRFTDFNRLSKEKILRDDISELRVVFERAKGIEDWLKIESSRWHTGQQIVRMTRYVTIDDVDRQPLVDAFISSILEKYGPLDDEPFSERRVRGLSGVFFTGRIWTWDAGRRNADCEIYGLPNDLDDVYDNKLDRLEALVADVNTPEACDAVIKIYHDKTAAGTVSRYKIEITDIRMLFEDALNDRRVREHIQLFLENSVRANNTNTPDL